MNYQSGLLMLALALCVIAISNAKSTDLQWTFMPEKLSPFSRFSVARTNQGRVTYAEAASHCSSIGYHIGTQRVLFSWRHELRSVYARLAGELDGPFYMSSPTAGPYSLIVLDKTGYLVRFGATDTSSTHPFFCVVLCDFGFVDTSVPNAPVCRCLPGWVGQRCEKRAFGSYTNMDSKQISVWVAPDAHCSPQDKSPSECALHSRHGWQGAQAACAAWAMGVASNPAATVTAGAFNKLASALLFQGFHQSLSIWLSNANGGRSLYEINRKEGTARVSVASLHANPPSDVICGSTWRFTTIWYGGRPASARLALKSGAGIRGSKLWTLTGLCAAMNMTAPVAWADNYVTLISFSLGRLGVNPPYNVPIRPGNWQSFGIARILSRRRYSFSGYYPNTQYSPVCIRVCGAGQVVNQYNQCAPARG
ncbi:uncharacterized protein LOC135820590 [Sycon ciliatum]|uniref:uncharacterized protein LOC135820590 n=1 Tax=Sycon ciliatum TaxID=27933 RepID=UPI0031F61A42